MNETKPNVEVLFNLGMPQNSLIGNLMFRASNHYLQGQLMNWFYDLKSIKLQIAQFLKPAEIAELEKMEQMVNKLDRMNDKVKIRNSLTRVIELYDMQIKQFLLQYGYFPLKKDRTNLFGQEDDTG